jgi:hypothetical protein
MPLPFILPPITYKGTASPQLVELTTRVSSKLLLALQGPNPLDVWRDFCGVTPTAPGEEQVRFIIDPEDLSTFEPAVGPLKMPESELASFILPQAPWRKAKGIPVAIVQRGAYGSYPDKVAHMLLAARRTVPRIIGTVLSNGASAKVQTYQGVPLFLQQQTTPSATNAHQYNPLDASRGFFYNYTRNVNFDSEGLEQAQDDMTSQLGLDGVETLGLEMTYILGGTKMRKFFRRLLKRILVLDETGTAAVTNVHYEALEGGDGAKAIIMPQLDLDADYQAGAQVWYTVSTTLPVARPLEVLLENDGVPSITVLGEGTEFATVNEKVLVKGTMAANAGAAWPHVIRKYVGQAGSLAPSQS